MIEKQKSKYKYIDPLQHIKADIIRDNPREMLGIAEDHLDSEGFLQSIKDDPQSGFWDHSRDFGPRGFTIFTSLLFNKYKYPGLYLTIQRVHRRHNEANRDTIDSCYNARNLDREIWGPYCGFPDRADEYIERKYPNMIPFSYVNARLWFGHPNHIQNNGNHHNWSNNGLIEAPEVSDNCLDDFINCFELRLLKEHKDLGKEKFDDPKNFYNEESRLYICDGINQILGK